MDAYERIIEQMRKSGKYYNAPVPQIGVVSSGKKIKIVPVDGECFVNAVCGID